MLNNFLNLKKNIKFVKYKYSWVTFVNYKKFMYVVASSTSLFFGLMAFFYLDSIEYAIYSTISVFVICIAFFYYYPFVLKKTYIGKIEKELPFFLIDLDMKLSIGQEFLQSIKELSKKYGFLGFIFTKIIANYNKGISLQKSFREYSEIFDSQDFKRALTQIMNVYEAGKSFKERGPLFELSEELINIQTTKTKLYSNKLVMISLFFIAVTAILPSLLLILVNVGGLILDLGITPIQLILIFTLVFPAIDLIIIFIIFNLMPSFLR